MNMRTRFDNWIAELTWRDYWRALRWSLGFAFLGWVMQTLFVTALDGFRYNIMIATLLIPNISPDTLFWVTMATSALCVWMMGILVSCVVRLCFPSETVIHCDGCGKVHR